MTETTTEILADAGNLGLTKLYKNLREYIKKNENSHEKQ